MNKETKLAEVKKWLDDNWYKVPCKDLQRWCPIRPEMVEFLLNLVDELKKENDTLKLDFKRIQDGWNIDADSLYKLQHKLELAEEVIKVARILRDYAEVAEGKLEPRDQLHCLKTQQKFTEALTKWEEGKCA